MHQVYEDFGNEKSPEHIKEPSRCIFTIVKLFPKLFTRLNHSKYFLNVLVSENVESKTCFQPTRPISQLLNKL